MVFNLSQTDPRPIYQQILDEIRRGIVVGLYKVGEPIPSVRQLAVDLKVNPNTVAQAYRELERLGVVEVRRGQGTFVSPQTSRDSERRTLITTLANKAVVEAKRNSIGLGELIEAIRSIQLSEESAE